MASYIYRSINILISGHGNHYSIAIVAITRIKQIFRNENLSREQLSHNYLLYTPQAALCYLNYIIS